MAKYLIPWSGGLDSTALIYKLLIDGHSVEALYTNLNNNKQDIRQLNAVRKMTKQYFSRYSFTLTEDPVLGGGLNRQNVLMLAQVPCHIFNILKYVTDHNYVALAYVMNDDAISFLDDIKSIYNSYNSICNRSLPELLFPFSKTKKESLYNSLPLILKKNITWCESDTKNNCGVCPSCKRMTDIIKRNS
jgi:7-cyano-7-deazaguanine synthase in queuosine biosynthesis